MVVTSPCKDRRHPLRGILPMRIAQIAPLQERVPPRLYGGMERVVSFLTEELVRQGHDVTLFASGDSRTSAKLVRCCEMALRLDPSVRDGLPYHMIMLDDVRRRIDQFDVLHFHIDLLHAPLVRDIADRTLTTLHGRLDLPDLAPFYGAFRELPLASISMVRHHLPRSSTRSSSSSQTRVATASLYKRSTIHPQYSAAAAPGFRCERTFSKWH